MKVLALIPARMGSNRFPGKPMASILGKPMIGHVFERVSKNSLISLTVVATCDTEIFNYIEGRKINKSITDDYYMFIREDGIDLGTYYFQTEKSSESSVLESKDPVGKWRSLWLNIPDGKHYYTISLPNLEENQDKTVFIRLKEWKKE